MRKVTFGGANSLDNYLARPDDAVDWLLWGDEAAELMKDYWRNIDTVLMGRRTWEAAAKETGGGADPYPGITNYVFSKTLKPGDLPEGIELVSADAAGFVADLKNEEGREICVMGGGDFARTLFEAGLIDEVGFNIHPVLLGRGIPLFHEMERQIDLELIECRPFKNGCVYVLYKVLH